MKRDLKVAVAILAGCIALFAVSVYAGQRQAWSTSGVAPTTNTDGVNGQDVSGCRAVVWSDAGYIGAGVVVYHGYHPKTGWSEYPSTFNCTIPNNTQDGGFTYGYICPSLDVPVRGNADRYAASILSLTRPDAGPVSDKNIQIECWGRAPGLGDGIP